jgi:hypothetical protein
MLGKGAGPGVPSTTTPGWQGFVNKWFAGANPSGYASPAAPSRPKPIQKKLPGRGTTDLTARMLGWVGAKRKNVELTGRPVRGQMEYRGAMPASFDILPTRITNFRRPPFWSPTDHYVRREYLVEPPLLPGTAIPWTLFHPVYIGGGGVGPTSPGLQGWKSNLYWGPGTTGPSGDAVDPRQANFGWIWGRNNFERFGAIAYLEDHPTTAGMGTKLNVWKPAMKVPQGAGTGAVWQQPQPDYTPLIVNPGGMGGRWLRSMGRGQ